MLMLVLLAATTAVSATDDVDVLARTFRALHPGLHRYAEVDLDRSLDALRAELAGTPSRAQVVLALMRFTASLRCSHTYVNPLNQGNEVAALLDRADRVPLAFRLEGRRAIVNANVSGDARLAPGSEILALDGRPMEEILARLWPLARGDGANDAKRRDDLSVKGDGSFETFDVAWALTWGSEGRVRVRARVGDGGVVDATVQTVARAERARRIGAASKPEWTSRRLADGSLLLRLPTFSTWTFDFDWRARLDALFGEASTAPRLILDVRGNEGGDGDVVDELFRRLYASPVTVDAPRALVRYRRLDPELGRHLKSWSDAFRDLGELPADHDGFYLRTPGGPTMLPHTPDAYRGPVVVLVDAANSSATFRLASVLGGTGRAQLAGRPTGGNRRGINGGLVAFFRLPATGVEIDLPLVGYFPTGVEKDEGLTPAVPLPDGARDEEILAALAAL